MLSSVLAWVFGLPPPRRVLFAHSLLPVMARVQPRLGDTERIALEAGTICWDTKLFPGRPRWRRLLNFSCQSLSPSEQEFLYGLVEQLCRMLDDWRIQQDRDLSSYGYKRLGLARKAREDVIQVAAFDADIYR